MNYSILLATVPSQHKRLRVKAHSLEPTDIAHGRDTHIAVKELHAALQSFREKYVEAYICMCRSCLYNRWLHGNVDMLIEFYVFTISPLGSVCRLGFGRAIAAPQIGHSLRMIALNLGKVCIAWLNIERSVEESDYVYMLVQKENWTLNIITLIIPGLES